MDVEQTSTLKRCDALPLNPVPPNSPVKLVPTQFKTASTILQEEANLNLLAQVASEQPVAPTTRKRSNENEQGDTDSDCTDTDAADPLVVVSDVPFHDLMATINESFEDFTEDTMNIPLLENGLEVCYLTYNKRTDMFTISHMYL